MEPKILMIGRRQEVVNILIDELKKFGRDILGAIEQEHIEKLLHSQAFDFVVIGGGLPDYQRDFLMSFIESIKPGLTVYLTEKKVNSKPHKLVNFTNRKAIEYKISQVIKKKESTD